MAREKQFLALRKTNLVFLIIFVFLLGTATYYALNWRAKEVSPAYIGPVSAPSVTQSPVVDWKVVEGDFFSFRYPLSWQERKTVTGGILLYGPVDEEKVFLGVQKSAYINANDEPEKLAAQALAEGESVLARKTILVDGHPAVIQERKSGEGVRFEAYIGEVKTSVKTAGKSSVTTGTKLVYLEAQSAESVAASREIFAQTLQGFKFEEE